MTAIANTFSDIATADDTIDLTNAELAQRSARCAAEAHAYLLRARDLLAQTAAATPERS